MRLKKLVISGFKSFADKATLEFSPGITVIVGPNGCGKSNIVDSFRWVMGEQSAKAIRGDKMLDIIFAGTAKRKPLNMAEVTLTFCDVEGHLPIDYDEVSICRRVYRDGESAFFINKNPVRLKDIESLFWDTGLGKDAFCIFEQGKIDQVIQSNPMDRRAIFEEAAGILRFKQRKKEAMKKLEQVQLNFSRAEDILREVSEQCVGLQKQAEKAALFRQKKVEVDCLEKSVFLDRWNRVHTKKVNLEEQLEQEKKLLEAIFQDQQIQQEALADQKNRAADHQQSVKTQTEQLYKAKNQYQLKQSELSSHKNQTETASKKIEKLVQEIQILQERRKISRSEYEQNALLLQKMEEEAKTAEGVFKECQLEVHSIRQGIEQARDRQKSVQQQRLQLAERESKLRIQLQEIRGRIEGAKERIQRLNRQQERFNEVIATLIATEHEKKQQLQELSTFIDEKRKKHAECEQQLSHLNEEIKAHYDKLKTLHREKTECSARQKALLRLKEDLEGFSAGTKRLMQESKQEKSPLFLKLRPLYELLVAKQGYEFALASALRPYAQTLVVRTYEELKFVLDYAKNHQLKEFSLFCLEAIEENVDQLPLVEERSLLAFIESSAAATSLLNGIMLVEDETQLSRSYSPWVSKNGFFKDGTQVLFSPIHAEKNTFLREAELKKLGESLSELDTTSTECEHTIAKLEERRQILQLEKTDLDKTLRSHEMKLVEINFGLQRAKADKEKTSLENEQAARDLSSVQETINNLEKSLSELTISEGDLKVEVDSKQAKFQESEHELQLLISHCRAREEKLKESETISRTKGEAFHRLGRQCQLYNATDQEQQQQENRLRTEHGNLLELIQSHESKVIELQNELIETESFVVQAQKILRESEDGLSTQLKAIADIEKLIQLVLEKIKMQGEKVHKKEIQLAEEKIVASSLEETLHNQYQCSIEEIEEEVIAVQLESIKLSLDKRDKFLRQLRVELEEMGDVNLTAEEEYDKQKAREEFLSKQLEDLQKSKDELIQIIVKLDEESRKIFEESFHQIRQNFQKNFNLLFEGGEADLTFTESKDLLEAGIEIAAKPPGKQMRSISLLSGGEKCLTAMALLFAIFEVKPSAFCLLDEVDAPLDEANVGRFTRMIKQFVDKTQFIIISHNKRTMSIADMLFGVSMEDKGVSKLLTLSFEKQDAQPQLVEA